MVAVVLVAQLHLITEMLVVLVAVVGTPEVAVQGIHHHNHPLVVMALQQSLIKGLLVGTVRLLVAVESAVEVVGQAQ
ncbi:MAG: hypothetical protein EB072_21485 [Betaproteobacteria bacterium]|nr:hypothetical protein [Betaproteobacteria bacterium]